MVAAEVTDHDREAIHRAYDTARRALSLDLPVPPHDRSRHRFMMETWRQ